MTKLPAFDRSADLKPRRIFPGLCGAWIEACRPWRKTLAAYSNGADPGCPRSTGALPERLQLLPRRQPFSTAAFQLAESP